MSGYKNYGAGVSQSPQDTGVGGQFSADDKSFESVVIQDDAPVIDWEMNLRTDVAGDSGRRLGAHRTRTSCFLDGDFYERPDVGGSYVFLPAVLGNENKFRIRAQNALINGWDVRVEYSSTASAGLNEVTLTAPPAAGTRTDLVILEVWRALVLAAPSAAHKSPTSLILRNGNAKAPDGVNLVDDLIDPVYALESSARVQIQYRLRVIPGVNLAAYPDGIDDPSVVANGASDFSGLGADGTPSVYTFAQVSDDGALWRAGTGDAASAAALLTVDGYMYAVPVCAVHRRNDAGFDRSVNPNGAVYISAGTSDRPDGLFVDQVVNSDVRDLRRGQAAPWDEVLDKAFLQVVNNTMTTWSETSAIGTGGTSFLYKDDLGVGGHIGNPDGVRTKFSDRAIVETIVAESTIGGLPQSSVVMNLANLKLPWMAGTTDLTGSSGVSIAAVNAVRIVDAVGTTDLDMFDPLNPYFVTSIVYSVFVGPLQDQVTITFNAPVSNVMIYAELAIEYPSGLGMSRNVLEGHEMWAPNAGLPAWVDMAGWLATSDANRSSMPAAQWWVDPGHRELALRFLTTSQVKIYYTSDVDELFIPERLTGSSITINDGPYNPVYGTTNYTFNTAYTRVQLTGGVPVPAGKPVTVTLTAYRPSEPLPGAPADSYTIFYQSRATQSILPPAGSQTLRLVPRAFGKSMSVILSGSGGPDDVSPAAASSQIPVGALPAVNYPEALLDGPASVVISGSAVPAGFLSLPVMVPYTPDPDEVTLYRDAPDPVTDADGRNFWPKSDDGLAAVYSPTVASQQLDYGQRHKMAYPVLMELKEDFLSIGRKGTVVLVVLTSWSDLDPSNRIELTPSPSQAAAAVYRVRGNLVNPRRPDY